MSRGLEYAARAIAEIAKKAPNKRGKFGNMKYKVLLEPEHVLPKDAADHEAKLKGNKRDDNPSSKYDVKSAVRDLLKGTKSKKKPAKKKSKR